MVDDGFKSYCMILGADFISCSSLTIVWESFTSPITSRFLYGK